MGTPAATTDGKRGPAGRLGFSPGQVVQEIGADDDADEDLRRDIEATTGSELTEDPEDVVDTVVLWWREDDGDLGDALVDALESLAPGGTIWLLTPKINRPGYVDPADIADAAPTAGLAATTNLSVTPDWAGCRLVAPRARR